MGHRSLFQFTLIVALVVAASTSAIAQPTPPQPGLTKVSHGNSLTGNGTTTVQLDVRVATGGGLDAGIGGLGVKLGPCSTGQVWQSVGATWACADNASTVAGTLGYVAKFTPDGSHVGNSLVFDDGSHIGIGTASPLYPLHVTSASTFNIVAATTLAASTVSATAAIGGMSGTADTTSGAHQYTGVLGTTNVTRSAGGGNVINVGLLGSATGGQQNYALYTTTGDVSFVGSGSGVDGIVKIDGVTGHTKIGTAGIDAITWLATSDTTAGRTADDYLISASLSGTANATAASRDNHAIVAISNVTRSAGSNSVVNVALYGSASGGQLNQAIETDNGIVNLNQKSDGTEIGTSTDNPTATLTVHGAAFADAGAGVGKRIFDIAGTGLSSSNNTVSLAINGGVTQTCGAGTAVAAMTGVGITSCTAFGSSNLTNGAGSNVVVKSDGTNLVASSRTDTGSAVAETLPITSTINSAGTAIPYTFANSGAGSVQLSFSAAAGTYTGFIQFDLAGGLVFSNKTATGGAIYFDSATGGEIHRNHSAATTMTIADNKKVTMNGDVAIGGALGINATPAAATAELIVSPISTTVIGASLTNALTSSTIGHTEINVADSGTYDGTSSTLSVYGVKSSITASRSAGANAIANIAGHFDASGAQTNIALETTGSGLVNFAGDTTIGSDALKITASSGNTRIGSSATYGFSSTSAASGSADSCLERIGAGIIRFSDCTGNYRDFYARNSHITGTFDVAGIATFNSPAIVFDNLTNATATGTINATGYNAGTTQFRNLQIKDGKGAQLALFDGANARTVIGLGADAPTVASAVAIFENAGTTSIAVRDATNDVEVAITASNLTPVIGTSTNHGLNIATNGTAAISIDTSQNSTFIGHIIGGSTGVSVAAGGGCGGSPSVAGNDNFGKITVGSSTSTCVLTFAHAYTSHEPACSATSTSANSNISISAAAAGSVTFSQTSPSMSGTTFYYSCGGY